GRDVAEHAAPGATCERVDQLRGKAVRVRRERSLEPYAGQLPVPRRAVLAGGRGLQESPCARRPLDRTHAAQRPHAPEPEPLEVRQIEPTDCLGDVTERVAPRVAV